MPYVRNFEVDDRAPPPMCRNLRSKSMHVVGTQDVSPEHGQVASGNCWCVLTQHVFGPDEKEVDRYECDETRTCYEAPL